MITLSMYKKIFNKKPSLNNVRLFSSKTENKTDTNQFDFLFKSIFFGTSITSTYLLYQNFTNKYIETLSIKELSKLVDQFENVKIINDNLVLIKRKDNNKFYRTYVPNGEYFEKHVTTEVPITFQKNTEWSSLIGPMVSLVLLGTFLFLMSKNGMRGIVDLNKQAKVLKDVGVKFEDIIGQKNARRSIKEFVDILKNREKYSKLGVNLPKGALLSGPPGTGKTLIAKAIAGESGLPFINMSGSDFNAMFVGVGSNKVKNLYQTAKTAANESGGCIIFIDEIDAIGQKRSVGNTFGGNSERENTLNQLLTEMDGFESNDNVVTFAATNRPELLDPALLRPGRFDRKILVDTPNKNDRRDLFNYYLNKLTMDKSIIDSISQVSSKLTPGFTGADISNIVNEAGIIAVRKDKNIIDENDIKEAIDYVILGNEKEDTLTDHERKVVAYHESGHAILSLVLEHVENPIKVSIVPREKGMLGFSQSEISEEQLMSKNKLEQYICVLMAGRASEEIFCGDITNGASNDIEKATEAAKKYVKLFGFSKNNYFMNQHDQNQFKDEISNYIKDKSDKDVIDILNIKYQETKNLVTKHKSLIERLHTLLLDRKTVYYNDIEDILKDDKIIK